MLKLAASFERVNYFNQDQIRARLINLEVFEVKIGDSVPFENGQNPFKLNKQDQRRSGSLRSSSTDMLSQDSLNSVENSGSPQMFSMRCNSLMLPDLMHSRSRADSNPRSS